MNTFHRIGNETTDFENTKARLFHHPSRSAAHSAHHHGVAIFQALSEFAPPCVAPSGLRSVAELDQLGLVLLIFHDPEASCFAKMLVDQNAFHASNRHIGATLAIIEQSIGSGLHDGD